MNHQELIPHLFRTEYSKITAVLSKLLGLEHLDAAEDIASEVFLTALDTWTYKGIPENPTAWLYAVAKNKAHNYLQRHQIFAQKVTPQVKSSIVKNIDSEIDLSEKNITDSQLQMLFAVCHPVLAREAQISLALRILGGFGICEIADAFLVNKKTISKRLYRAKEKLRTQRVKIEFPPDEEIAQRLDSVLTTLYLLFNEGYYSESQDTVIREDLCLEAMRLTYLLIQNEPTNLPPVKALLALMCFHASRFPARKTHTGEILLYQDQDETLWNQELITKGGYYLHQAAQGNVVTKYHLEAGIAYWHTQKEDTPEKWEQILQLYNHLLMLEYSPMAALNRTFALAKANGKAAAIIEAQKLQLTNNHYYYTLLGELYQDLDNHQAKLNLQKAYSMAKSEADKQTLKKKIQAL